MSLRFINKDELTARMQSLGIEPKRSLGQNFLISERVVAKIIETVERLGKARPALIEVGPGLGSLTESLLTLEKPLTLLELDKSLARFWRERGGDVMEGDALKLDWRTLNLPQGTLFVSNLPYQISSSLVVERSVEPAGIEVMILMFQKEVAQRTRRADRHQLQGAVHPFEDQIEAPRPPPRAAPAPHRRRGSTGR